MSFGHFIFEFLWFVAEKDFGQSTMIKDHKSIRFVIKKIESRINKNNIFIYVRNVLISS